METERIKALESLRGFAAICVVLYHFDAHSLLNNELTRNAWLMVDFFFVLSGFVISLTYSQRLNTAPRFLRFAKRRFYRLYPLHLLTLACLIGFELTKYLANTQLGFKTATAAFAGNSTLETLWPNLLMLQNFILEDLSWNRPSWSISAEFVTYLVFGAFILLTTGNKQLRAAGVATVIIGSQLILQSQGMGTNNIEGPTRCVFSFFVGYLACKIYRESNSPIHTFFTGICLAFSLTLVVVEDSLSEALKPLIPLAFALTIYAVAKTPTDSKLIRSLEVRPLVFLGTISFGIYMWHQLALYLVKIALQVFAKEGVAFIPNSPNGMAANFDKPLLALISVAAVLALSIALATASYYWFEKRLNQRHKRNTAGIEERRNETAVHA